jgi:hypothetical protein
MNDGYIDCLLGDDEMNVDYLPINLPYRYQCVSTDRPQFVSVQVLGNSVMDCLDGSDELSPNLQWSFFRCEFEIDYACWVFRNAENIKEVQLSFHRHCDSIWDTMDGRDEQNCSNWVCPISMYQCNKTGQCIDRSQLCDGEFDCSNGEDEFKCSNKKNKPYSILEDRCDDEYFCITFDYLYHPHSHRPCINLSKVGNGIFDCIGGRDERNVFSCSDHEMLGDRFVCDNKTQCISHRAICNGIHDCVDESDEYICNWNQNKSCIPGQFTCMNGSCVAQRCVNKKGCIQEKENLFWCPNGTPQMNEEYRSTKIRRLSNYASFCNLHELKPTSSILTLESNVIAENRVRKYDPRLHGYCNRGFYLLTKNETLPVCFCPPSFYGDRCQFNRRRITVRFRLDRFSSSNIPPVLHILVSLVYNDTIMVDHTTRVDVKGDFAMKHDMHLLYPRPKPNGSYSVRIEAYSSLNLLTAWEYPVNPLDFLPVLRIAKVLRFPDIYPPYCPVNLCKNNGTCHIVDSYERNRYICLCQQNWTGKHCEQQQQSKKCSSNALIHNGGLCICPEGYLLPNCFIRNTVCDTKQPCLDNEICVPHSTMYGNYTCSCTTKSNCCGPSIFLTLTGESFTNSHPLVIQLLKFSSDYPRLRQQLLVSSLFRFPIVRTIDTRDTPQKPISIPDIGLLYTFNRTSSRVLSFMSLLYINCSNELRNLTVDLDTEPRLCHSIEEPSPPAQYLHTYCRTKDTYACFYTNSYICYCSTTNNRSECISYRERETSCSHCLNQGFCAQGDLQNRSDFECICPVCVTGDLCQFSLKRFSVSFEWLIEKTQWAKLHLIVPVIFATFGLAFNCLTIATLSKPKARSTGVGVVLLLNSIISQSLLILSVTRVTYLQLLRQASTITTTNIVLCKGLPYVMSSLSYISSWLMALVSIERASMVQLSTSCQFFQNPKSVLVLSVMICISIFGSLYKQLEQYKLVSHPNSNIWCIQEISMHEQTLFQILSIIHQLIPFIINVLSSLAIIITIGRSKAASHHLPQHATLIEQARKRVHLLLGPFICFISQLPQLIMLFLNPCTYDNSQWFSHIALIAYYITFAPHISLFFMYIIPSPLYKELFLAIVHRQ